MTIDRLTANADRIISPDALRAFATLLLLSQLSAL